MTDTTPPHTVRFARLPRGGILLGLTTAQLVCIGLAATILVPAMLTRGALGAAITSLAWAPLTVLAFGTWQGRRLVDTAPTYAHYLARSALGQRRYLARPNQPRPSGTLALPGDAARLRFLLDDTGTAMLHDPHEATLTAVAHIRHPAYVLLAPEEQAARVHGWGRALAGIGNAGGVRIQVLEQTLPDAGQGIVGWWHTHRPNPFAGAPRWPVEQYDQLMDTAVPSTSTHRTLIALTLDLRATRSHIRQAGRGLAGAAALLRQEMTSLENGLRGAELTLTGWMSELQLAAVLRAAYQPGHDDTPTLGGLATAGPMAVDEHWAHIRHDDAYSAVLWISEWPRVEAPTHFLHTLVFQPAIRKTLSLSIEPVPVHVAMREIRRAKVELVTEAAQKAKIGAIADLADTVEHTDVLEREQALVAGHADTRYTGLLTVTSASREELEADLAEITRAALQSGCETRRLYGQQARAFTATLPLGRKVHR